MMTASDILNEDVSDFASRLEAMTTDEVFAAMSTLEEHSETDANDRDEAVSRIALIEDEIERRFPEPSQASGFWNEKIEGLNDDERKQVEYFLPSINDP